MVNDSSDVNEEFPPTCHALCLYAAAVEWLSLSLGRWGRVYLALFPFLGNWGLPQVPLSMPGLWANANELLTARFSQFLSAIVLPEPFWKGSPFRRGEDNSSYFSFHIFLLPGLRQACGLHNHVLYLLTVAAVGIFLLVSWGRLAGYFSIVCVFFYMFHRIMTCHVLFSRC